MSLANFQRNAKNINEYHMKHANDVEVRMTLLRSKLLKVTRTDYELGLAAC